MDCLFPMNLFRRFTDLVAPFRLLDLACGLAVGLMDVEVVFSQRCYIMKSIQHKCFRKTEFFFALMRNFDLCLIILRKTGLYSRHYAYAFNKGG